MSGSDTMRQVLVRAAQDHGVPMKALTVLDTKNDPFRIDTPANHRDGRWLATHVERLGIERAIHLRGLHYVLVTDAPAKPNGDAYRNTDADWSWLQEKAADAARWLGYISFDRIVDKRNAAPVVREFDPPDPRALIGTGVDVDVPDADDLEPRVFLSGYRGVQPYRLVAVGEKSSLDEVLGPICPTYGADLYLPTGEISDTLAHRMAATAAAEGRALVVLYFSDADPAGWQMPVSLGRKLQGFKYALFPDLEFEVHRVALTPDQVREYGLPSTPLKPTERRADKWREATGTEQTEIDALAALRPQLLKRLARDAFSRFHDATLERRVWRARDEWEEAAQATLDEQLDGDQIGRIRREAGLRLAELREQINELNEALRFSVDGIHLPDVPPIPTAELNGHVHGTPLLDSRWPFVDQCRRLIGSKGYGDVNGEASL